MTQVDTLPEIKQIIGAMIFASKVPVTVAQLKRAFVVAATNYEGHVKDYALVKDKEIRQAVEELNDSLKELKCGFSIIEVANGYRLQNDASCGPWLRTLLEKGKTAKLSHPALETLAIIAYRQPVTRSEIEAVRGVSIDAMVRSLLEMQLIKAVGRSEMPGRPWLFGTTQKFLEHFGLKNLNELPGADELKRIEQEKAQEELPLEEVIEGENSDESEASGDEEDAVPEESTIEPDEKSGGESEESAEDKSVDVDEDPEEDFEDDEFDEDDDDDED